MADAIAHPSALDPDAAAALRRSWAQLAPLADLFALTLYRRLFEQAPHLRHLFHVDIEAQGRRVMEVFDQAIRRLDAVETLVPSLEALGRRHFYAGVRQDHFRDLEIALMRTLEDLLGPSLDEALRTVWSRFYGLITGAMLRGFDSVARPPERPSETPEPRTR